MSAEQYLINKYGVNICKYSGFEITCYTLNTYINNNLNMFDFYKELGKRFNKNYKAIERNIRYFRFKIRDNCATNKDFILNNIIGYRNIKGEK